MYTCRQIPPYTSLAATCPFFNASMMKLSSGGSLEVGDEVLALSGLLDAGEDHLGAL